MAICVGFDGNEDVDAALSALLGTIDFVTWATDSTGTCIVVVLCWNQPKLVGPENFRLACRCVHVSD